MSLQFIMGGSGSGKTYYLYQQLIRLSLEQPDRRFFAVVPEQFTMQTQKEVITLHPNHGFMNLDIVSFQRLAYRVFEELAVETLTVLDDMGKSMVLRRVAGSKKKELGMYRNHLDKAGFISQMKSVLSEFYQYGIGVEEWEKQIKETADHPILEQKFKDIAVLYRGFQEYIQDRFVTAEEILDVLCRVLPKSQLIKDSIVTLDGYTGFTPVQYRLIQLLMSCCSKVIVTCTIDPAQDGCENAGYEDLFYMSRHTVGRLTRLAEESGVELLEDIRLNSRPLARFKNSRELDFLERELFRYSRHTLDTGEEAHDIILTQAQNPLEEVEKVVGEIIRLVKTEHYRYRDIAVVTGDLAGYGEKLACQFEKDSVPCFLDQKKSLIGNPMVELIRAAMDVVLKDFSYESVFRYLKTGLVSSDWEMICRMENYVIALGIRGFRRWNSYWDSIFKGGELINLEELNQFRQSILEPLCPFCTVMHKKSATVREMTAAVVTLLEALSVEEKLNHYCAYFTERGEFNLAKEYEQAYGLVMDLADRLAGLLGDEAVGKREYADILDAGFDEIKVGLIPATVDRVVVGDITRTRLNQVKILFFIGVNDGVVPSARDSSGILSDQDREFLKSRQVELAPTAREDGFMQRFYLYLLLTKPGEKLYLSYAGTSSSGKSIRPSYLISAVKKMIPGLAVQEEGNVQILSLEAARSQLTKGLRSVAGDREALESEDNSHFKELLQWFLKSENHRNEAEKLAEGAFYRYQELGIGRAVARALYGNVLSGSVTRLEQYAACAYAHFLTYGLELDERREYELAAVDMGNLFHNSIDLFFKEMSLQGRDFNTLTEEARKQLVSSCVSQAASQYGNTILKSSARNAYLAKRLERITDRTVWALGEQIKKGDFVPAAFEVSFSAADNLQAMKFSLSKEEELHLRGRIDRLDLYEDQEHVYVKIIDYKSGSTSFDLAALYYGLQLQLVIYMDAVLELEERKHPDKLVQPAGIFYYNINDPLVEKKEGMDEEEIKIQILRQLKMNGLVNSQLDIIRHLDHTIETESDVIPVVMKEDEILESRSSVAGLKRFEALRSFVKQKAAGIGAEILSGETEINPYKQGGRTACDYCPYHAVCGFDLKTTGFGFKRFKELKSDKIWEKIESPPHICSADGLESPPHICSADGVETPDTGEGAAKEGGSDDGNAVDG